MKNTMAIIDGNYCMMRSIFGSPNLTYAGNPTGGLHVFLNILWNVASEYSETICVFDKGRNSHRLEIYPDYKKRDHSKEDLEFEAKKNFTFEYGKKFLELVGIRSIQIPGQEADDIIYYLCKNLRKDYAVTAISDDSDYVQMINLGVNVYQPMKNVLITPSNYEDMTDIPINLFVYIKSLTGDGSDNIPGIPGIGQKTAESIMRFVDHEGWNDGTHENIMNGICEWASPKKNKKQIAVSENIDLIERNLKLVDISLMNHDEELYMEEYEKSKYSVLPNLEELEKFFISVGFNSHSKWYPYCIEQAKKIEL